VQQENFDESSSFPLQLLLQSIRSDMEQQQQPLGVVHRWSLPTYAQYLPQAEASVHHRYALHSRTRLKLAGAWAVYLYWRGRSKHYAESSMDPEEVKVEVGGILQDLTFPPFHVVSPLMLAFLLLRVPSDPDYIFIAALSIPGGRHRIERLRKLGSRVSLLPEGSKCMSNTLLTRVLEMHQRHPGRLLWPSRHRVLPASYPFERIRLTH